MGVRAISEGLRFFLRDRPELAEATGWAPCHSHSKGVQERDEIVAAEPGHCGAVAEDLAAS